MLPPTGQDMMLGLAVSAGDDVDHIPGTESAGVPAEMPRWFGRMMLTWESKKPRGRYKTRNATVGGKSGSR